MDGADKPEVAAGFSARHRLYIDGSGDYSYNLFDDSPHRYLALLGA